MATDNMECWEDVLNKLNKGIAAERSILYRKLHTKIEELKAFKAPLNQVKETNLDVVRVREERIGILDTRLTQQRTRCAEAAAQRDALSEEVRIAHAKIGQYERENAHLRQELQNKGASINQLRMQLLPSTGFAKTTVRSGKLQKLEDALKDSEHFYQYIAHKIDMLLK